MALKDLSSRLERIAMASDVMLEGTRLTDGKAMELAHVSRDLAGLVERFRIHGDPHAAVRTGQSVFKSSRVANYAPPIG